MAFKTRWYCEYCQYTMWAETQPEEHDCPKWEEHEMDAEIDDLFGDGSQFAGRHAEVEKPVVYSKEEQKERYRIAYHLRGGTWEGVQPYVWTGESLAEGQRLCEEAKRRNCNRKKAEAALHDALMEGR